MQIFLEHSNYLTPNDPPPSLFKRAVGLAEATNWLEKAPPDFNVETDAGPMKAVYNDQLVTDGTVPWVHKIVSCRRPGLKGFQQAIVTVQPYRVANVTPRTPSSV
jgi:hypothetical protein